MANQTVTKTPDAYWQGSWISSNVSSARCPCNYDKTVGYKINRSPAATVSSCSIKVRFITPYEGDTGSIGVECRAVGSKNGTQVWANTQRFDFSYRQDADHTFSFSGASGDVDTVTFWIGLEDGQFYPENDIIVTYPTATYTYAPPTLGLSVTPASLFVGETITGTIENTFGQTFNVRFAYGSTTLQSFSTPSDSFTQTANESWFTAAGVAGDSMQVTVSISDGLGRSASGRVTVNKHTALVPSITAPRGGNFDGGQEIAFIWSSSGDGYQTGAELQWSQNNVNWNTLTTVSGSGTDWTAPGTKFPAGTIYWRLRLTNSRGLTSGWVSQNFTVTYTGASVTLTTPTSGTLDGGQQIVFAWEIAKGTGTIDGTQMQISSDDGIRWTNLVNSSTSVTSYTAAPGYLPQGRILWHVRARDSYSGWGEWRQAAITVAYTGASVTLISPTSGTLDGGQQNTFAWSIDTGSGTAVTGVQMQISNDDGISWETVLDYPGMTTSYISAAGRLPSGRVIWRVRARGTYGDYSAWKQATVTVNYTPATVTLTSPTSGSWDGAEQITFGWSVTAGSGSVTGTQMQISTDDGLTWTDLINSSSQVTTYSANVAQFPAGRLLWRVRAKDSYSGWGEWKQATITVTYSAVSQVVAVNSPTSGVYNAAAARTFTVRLDPSGPVHTPFQIQTASFFWRSGETGEFTELAMTPGGNTATVEIPAGTFPSGRIEWYTSATDTTGRTTETPHYVLTALQTAVEAAPLSPINTIESGSGPITFRWTYGSLDGAPQGRAQLQYSRDGETWTDEHIFADITGDGTSYIAEQGTFPGGTIFWRVRSYNDAGTAGPWSAAVSFSSYSAPLVTGVTGDGKPFATITWQADGQEAYEIGVGGKTYGPYYGADVRSFTLPEPLPDGSYTIRVRAQNKMTLWSQWIEGQMSVANVPAGYQLWIMADSGENVHLRVFIGTLAPSILKQPQDAQGTSGEIYYTVSLGTTQPGATLYGNRQWYVKDPGGDWQPFTGTGATSSSMHFTAAQELDGRQVRCRVYNAVGEIYTRTATYHYAAPNMKIGEAITGEFYAETGYFLVYRDGVLIGKTYNTFDDRTALGEHEYRYVQVLPGGYYNSDTATGTASVTCPAIAPLEGGDFLSLKLSENSDREVRITQTREVEWTQYAGADYPSAEIGEGKSKAVALDVSALMSDEDFAKAFTALLGKDVIVKTPDGTVVIGPLESLDLRAPRSHRSWTFGVTQMEWSDYVDES